MSDKLLMSSRIKLILSLAVFAPTALILLTEPNPVTVIQSMERAGQRSWAQMHHALVFSMIADGLAWLSCLGACFLVVRLAHHLRHRVPFNLTTYLLGLFLVFIAIQRVVGYMLWNSLIRYGTDLQMVRAVAMVIVAMGVAVLFPFVHEMIESVIAANEKQEMFVVAAESSMDAFYIHKCVRDASNKDATKNIVDFRISYVNANGEKRLGIPRAELIGRNLSEILPHIVKLGLMDRYRQVVLTGKPYAGQYLMERENIAPYWISMQVVKLGDGVAVTNRDITEERARLRQIEELSDFTQSIIENAPFSIIATDPAGTVTAMNPAAETLTHYRKHELIGQHSMVLLHDPAEMSARAVQLSKDLRRPVQAGFNSLIEKPKQGQTDEREWTYVRKDGSRIWVNLAMTALKSSGERIAGYLGIAFDVTERKKLTEYVNHLAHHDQLTGLPNRLLLEDRMRQAIQRARRSNRKVAVLMMDIDYFKRINDSLGHAAGDALLDVVAQKLCSSVRQTDTVARIGGDEFIIVMPEFLDQKNAEHCALAILQKVAMPIVINDREVNVTMSIGMCIYPDCASDADSLIKNADAALYEAKESGRNCYHMFNESMVVATADKLEFELDLRHAQDNGELSLLYQPQVSCITGEVIGLEALLRWTHPRRGLISPGQFIALAEATGLIVPFGEWTIRTACREGKELQKTLGRELTIAVNLSPRQFRQKNLPELVEEALRDSELAPECLEIEITEQTLMSNSTTTSETLLQLRKLGVKIAIDDFGTGFSSLSYLLQYKVDRLKIDRSFVERLATDPNSAAIVRAIIFMAHGLNLKVVAEGVETRNQLDFLLRCDCDEAQGFYFAKAVPANMVDEVTRLIVQEQPHTSSF